MLNMDKYAKGNSNFCSKGDIEGPTDITIAGVTEEAVGEDGIKAILHIKFPILKPLVLNVTNTSILIAMLGNDAKQWEGKTVCLYNDPTIQYAGKVTGGLRIRPISDQYAREQVATNQSMAAGVPNDDIPF